MMKTIRYVPMRRGQMEKYLDAETYLILPPRDQDHAGCAGRQNDEGKTDG